MKKLLSGILLLIFSNGAIAQIWSGVGSGVSGTVNALDSCMGKLYVGGSFTDAGGKTVHNIAAWNGSMWTSLDSGLNGEVNCMTNYNGKLVVGGCFSAAGEVPIRNIAMWDGTNWTALGNGINNCVYAVAVYNGNLYAGGYFDSAGTVSAASIAEWNGTTWIPLSKGLDGEVLALASYNGNLYAGGYIDTAGNLPVSDIAKWNGVTWDTLSSEMQYINSCPNSFVASMTVYHNELIIGGLIVVIMKPYYQFTLVGWDDTSFVTVPATKELNTKAALTVYEGHLFTGGAPLMNYQDIAELNDTIWDSIGNGILACQPQTSCSGCAGGYYVVELNTIAGYNGILFAGGSFSTTYGNQASYLEQYNGPLVLNEIIAAKNKITVYPNPSKGVFNLNVVSNSPIRSEDWMVGVYNLMGQEVYAKTLHQPQGDNQINLVGQPTGVYFYRVTSEKGELLGSGKLVIER